MRDPCRFEVPPELSEADVELCTQGEGVSRGVDGGAG